MDSPPSSVPNIPSTPETGNTSNPSASSPTAKIEDYDFKVAVDASKDAASEHVVVVRVYDKYENMGAAKTVLKGK